MTPKLKSKTLPKPRMKLLVHLRQQRSLRRWFSRLRPSWPLAWMVGLLMGLSLVWLLPTPALPPLPLSWLAGRVPAAEVAPSDKPAAIAPSPTILRSAWPFLEKLEPPEPSTLLTGSTLHPSIQYLGHLRYAEAEPDQLMVVGSYSRDRNQRFEQLHRDAGLALMQMIDTARAQGVWIVPVSGFRDRERQEQLFQSQTELVGSAAAAARAVAPPGYSEHHTGFAVDLADGLARAMDISLSFGETQAFQWLTDHAQEFGFELSFPQDNAQGVNYEPWHWRYVGSAVAAQTFVPARQPE